MRTHATALIVGLTVILAGTPADADPIYMNVGLAHSPLFAELAGVSWHQTTQWTDVEVSLEIYNYGLVGSTTSATVYLLDSIGPGTTQTNEIASAVITSNVPFFQTVIPFAGLTLGPGTYYLAYQHAGKPGDLSTFLTWLSNFDGAATTTTAPDVTKLDEFQSAGPLPPYAPAASTVDMPFLTQPIFAVTGTPIAIPEPATLVLMLGGATGVALRTQRRNQM
jgi:hypothetical protein